jgi:hypothetical protein
MTRRIPGLAVTLVVATAALIAAGAAATFATPSRYAGADDSAGGIVSFLLPVAAFSLVGAVVAVRRPSNLIGWLLGAIGLLFAVVGASSSVSAWALRTDALPKAVGEWLDVPSSAWVPALSLIGTQLPLRLPDGNLPSPRWRWYSRVSLALIAVAFVGMSVQPGRVEGVAGTANPLGAESLKWLAGVFFLVILCYIGGLSALVVRYRRAGSHDRVQLRWIAFGGALFLGVYLVTLPLASVLGLPADSVGAAAITDVAQASFAALPIAIGYAILKHRLYDVDVVVNRALVYAAVTATLAGAYLASVLVLQFALNGVTGDSGLAVAGSTLAVAALFRPARSRIQALVDRRFYRRKYDAQRTLESFAARLRDEVALDALSAELRGVVAETMQPEHVSLWLRAPEGER